MMEEEYEFRERDEIEEIERRLEIRERECASCEEDMLS